MIINPGHDTWEGSSPQAGNAVSVVCVSERQWEESLEDFGVSSVASELPRAGASEART